MLQTKGWLTPCKILNLFCTQYILTIHFSSSCRHSIYIIILKEVWNNTLLLRGAALKRLRTTADLYAMKNRCILKKYVLHVKKLQNMKNKTIYLGSIDCDSNLFLCIICLLFGLLKHAHAYESQPYIYNST